MDHPPQGGTGHSGKGGAPCREASPHESSLVRAAQDGDRTALEELLTGCLPLVHRIVARALDGHADTDDLVQEVMLRVVRGLPRLREPARFRSWAVAITYRQIQQYRRRRRHPHVEPFPEHAAAEPVDPRADFADRSVAELVLAEQRRDIVRASRWLERDDRHVLALWWEETAGVLSRGELAEALRLPRSHTAVRVQRMKEQLQTARLIVGGLSAVPRCPGLTAAARGWDGQPSGLWRKRLGRHVRDCPACGSRRAGLIPPERLLPGIAVLPVPTALPAGIGELLGPAGAVPAGAAPDLASHTVPGARPRLAAGAAAAGLVMLLGALMLPPGQTDPAGPSRSAPRTAPAPAAGVTGPSPSPSTADAHDLYVAPDGSDERGDGSLARPYATLGKAAGLVRPGRRIVLRGGVHRPAEPVVLDTDGSAGKPITLTAYRGERPVLDLSRVAEGEWAVVQRADHWTVRDLEVRGARGHAWVCDGCAHGVFDGLDVHHSGGSGLVLRGEGTVGNTVVDSDFHDNHRANGDGTGLAIVFGAGDGNTVRRCRAWGNGGDGVDLGGFMDPVLLEGNWSYGNGNGFTFGGGRTTAAVAHVARSNAAWDNEGYGFNDQGNTGPLTLERNSSYRNGLAGYRLADSSGTVTGNAAWNDGRETAPGPAVRSAGNTWDAAGPVVSVSDLGSQDPDTAQGPRRADGSLPRTVFLRPRDPATPVGAPMTS
ncbi:sigma-70 family RNA polymerase sigma factor [Streptomyces sp. DSM 41972]|uniref:Sigma-70 family RNA polymerase sigma factor n=1 Tax=Streptomyces althioticus subsp. attaecolombicae TaxID=3075534 RepID=A0ABU3I1A9_9ACTN|nr:sigma-70 family RNA polymerase sigma factor [Streptomyces sp. DSM 41972]SCD57267.1 RNA polymerase sigma factor, sigma-70 family [Streptomyces sp. di50b]SCE21188.1 RNA polymerase sigma factor, sigma-70 family [Streptomyces sp. di188]